LGILDGSGQRQTGKRGPWSQANTLRANLGCSIGIDLEATHVRGIVLDFADNITATRRHPLAPSSTQDEIVSAVTHMSDELVGLARAQGVEVCAVGLGLPGPLTDIERGVIRADMQFGQASLEFVPPVEEACGLPVFATSNSYCFAAGHHRMRIPRSRGIEMIVLNRFGLAAAVVWNGQLYTGASHYAGDLGMLPYGSRRYHDFCTGAALLRMARDRGDDRPFTTLLQTPDDPLAHEWLREAAPAFAQAICTAVIAYNPDSVLIEGIFNRLPREVRDRVMEAVLGQLDQIGNMVPEIGFFQGDDLMGARGAALLARDNVADAVLAGIVGEHM